MVYRELRTECANLQKNSLINNNKNNDNINNRNISNNNNMQVDENRVDILIEGQDEYKKILKSLKPRRVIFNEKQKKHIIKIVEQCSIFLEGKHAEETEEWDPYDQVGLHIRRTCGYETLRWQQVLKMPTYFNYF